TGVADLGDQGIEVRLATGAVLGADHGTVGTHDVEQGGVVGERLTERAALVPGGGDQPGELARHATGRGDAVLRHLGDQGPRLFRSAPTDTGLPILTGPGVTFVRSEAGGAVRRDGARFQSAPTDTTPPILTGPGVTFVRSESRWVV